MTTIAICRTFIAADGLSVSSGLRVEHDATKLIVNEKRGVIYAMTGVSYIHDAFVAWVEAGAKPAKFPQTGDDAWSAIAVSRQGITRYASSRPYPETRWPLPLAAGSGSLVAMGAMLAGADAITAVRIASLIDTSTGGEIEWINLADFFGTKALDWPGLTDPGCVYARVRPKPAWSAPSPAAKAPRLHRGSSRPTPVPSLAAPRGR